MGDVFAKFAAEKIQLTAALKAAKPDVANARVRFVLQSGTLLTSTHDSMSIASVFWPTPPATAASRGKGRKARYFPKTSFKLPDTDVQRYREIAREVSAMTPSRDVRAGHALARANCARISAALALIARQQTRG